MQLRPVVIGFAVMLISPIALARGASPFPEQTCRSGSPQSAHTWRPSGTARQQNDDRLDFDGDGKPDTFNAVDDGGSGEGGRTVTIELSRDGMKIRADVTFSFYGFVAHNPVPAALVGNARKDLREAVESVLFARVCDRPEPSLEWLLDDQHRLRWYAGPPRLPEMYTLLETDSAYLDRLRRTRAEYGEDFQGKAVWLTYLGHNHRRQLGVTKDKEIPYVMVEKGNTVLLGTAHGVILTNPARDRHAWIYIRPGGQKLRFPSVVSAEVRRGEAVIQLSLGQYETIGEARVNLETGAMSERFCHWMTTDETGQDVRRERCPRV